MSTESLKYARFDHPEHGPFESADALMADTRLTTEEKRSIVAEWRRRVDAHAQTEPDAVRMGETLDRMAESLASMRI